MAAIGPGTAAVLAEAGISVDLQPRQAVAESLLEALGDPPTPGARLLLARAEVGRDVLPDGLRSLGWSVDVVAAYRTVTPPPDATLATRVAQATPNATRNAVRMCGRVSGRTTREKISRPFAPNTRAART